MPEQSSEVVTIAKPLVVALPITALLFANVGYWAFRSPVEEPALLATFRGHTAPVSAIAISADKRTLASGSEDESAKIWDLATGKALFTLKGHKQDVRALGFSADGKMLATGWQDVKLWDVDTGKELAMLPLHRGVITVVFSPDGRTLATESDGELVQLWNVETRQLKATLQNYLGSRTSGLAFSRDGKLLATASETEPYPKLPKLWDAATGELLTTFEGQETRPSCVAFSPDGTTLAVGAWRPHVKLYDVQTKKERATLRHTCMISNVVFSADGKTLAMSGAIGKPGEAPEVVLWDVATGERLRTLRPNRKNVSLVGQSFTAQAFSPEGKLWATGCADNTIKLWKLVDD